jgi:hypothetical protein
VESVAVGVEERVPASSIDPQGGARNDPGGSLAADFERHDRAVITVDHQGRDVDLLQIRAEVGGRERRDALVGGTVSAGHALQPEGVAEPLVDVTPAVVPEERAIGEVAVELRPPGGLTEPSLSSTPPTRDGYRGDLRIAQLAAGQTDQHPDARGLVRSVQPAPRRSGDVEPRQRRSRVSFREQHRPGRRAAVHSRARRRSKRSEQPAITVQYAIPAYIGDTSPDVTPTMSSSNSAMRAGPWPRMITHMPWARRDIVSRSMSLKRWPTVTLSANAGCAPSGSPPHIRAKAFQMLSRERAFSRSSRSSDVAASAVANGAYASPMSVWRMTHSLAHLVRRRSSWPQCGGGTPR